jgi:hypothetical protein
MKKFEKNKKNRRKEKKNAFTTQAHAGVILANLVSIDG